MFCPRFSLFALFLSLISFNLSATQLVVDTPEALNKKSKRPVVGLVLSGGGAKGLAHLGVIKVLEEMKIPVDIIVGTSAGASVGGVYAMGMPLSEIEERFHAMDWDLGLKDEVSRSSASFRRKKDDYDFASDLVLGVGAEGVKFRKGLIQGQQLMLILSELTGQAEHVENFDQFPIRYRAIASDIETGEAVAIDKGSLALAFRASMSVPGAFPPVEYEGHLLVDGGMSANLPVDFARELGAEVIIAVDISSLLLKGDDVNSMTGVIEQLGNLLTRKNVEEQIKKLNKQDILLVPNLEGAGAGEFERTDEIVEMGATSARNSALALKALSVSDEEWNTYKLKRQEALKPSQFIDRIELINRSQVANEFISSRISQPEKAMLDRVQLKKDIDDIYGLGYFELVTYEIVNKNGKNVLVITAVEKSWGPDYLRFGLNFEENFSDDTRFNIAVHYDQTAINTLGAEWQTSLQIGSHSFIQTEFYQPLSYLSQYFIALGGVAEQKDVNVYVDGDKVAEWQITKTQAEFSIGREFGNDAEFRLLSEFGSATAQLEVGTINPRRDSVDIGSMKALFTYDSLDNLFLPHEGSLVQLSWDASRKNLSASYDYDRVSAAWGSAFSYNRYTLIGRVTATAVINDTESTSDIATLGGLFRLSGYGRDEIIGQDSGLAGLMVYREFGGPFIPYMLGFSYEVGNAWSSLNDASMNDYLDSSTVFLGSDTPLGPVILAASYGDSEHKVLYLTIGYNLFNLF